MNWKPEQWMSDTFDVIGDTRLRDLTLPGTHNAASASLASKLCDDASSTIKWLWGLGPVADFLRLQDYIEGMATCQSRSVTEQLEMGVRHLDLRVIYYEDRQRSCHSLVVVQLISQLLEEIAVFLHSHPGEIVLVKVGPKPGDGRSGDETQADFEASVKEVFDRNGVGYHTSSTASTIKAEMKKTVRALLDEGTQALFYRNDFFVDNYDGDISGQVSLSTNQMILDSAKDITQGGWVDRKDSEVIRGVQLNRTVSLGSYVAGFVAMNGCAVVIQLPTLRGNREVEGALSALGLTSTTAASRYFGYADPVPMNLEETAWDSVSILRDYFDWLEANPKLTRPSVVTCDHFQCSKVVDLCVRTSLGESVADVTATLEDKAPPRGADYGIQCTTERLAAALRAFGRSCEWAAEWLDDEVPGLAGDTMAAALKSAGYAAEDVASAVEEVYDLSTSEVEAAMKAAGYTSKEIEKAFKKLGGEFEDFVSDAGDVVSDAGDFVKGLF